MPTTEPFSLARAAVAADQGSHLTNWRRAMSIRLGSRRVWLGLAAGTALTMGAGAAFGSIPDGGGVIHACYDNNGGLRVIDTALTKKDGTCKSQETALDWNRQGPVGIAGSPGPK